MLEKDIKSAETKYVSCIKINGSPILPPLITHAKRKEIHRHKQQAVKLEKRLQRERELRQYINRYYSSNLENCDNLLITSSLEHRLSFEDDLISQINDMGNESRESPLTNHVPSVIQKKTPSLSCDLQVSQYANNEFTVLTSFGKCKSDIIAIDESPYFSSSENVDLSGGDYFRPRLVRSDSYILESPSPALLEHMRKQNESSDTIDELVPKIFSDKAEDIKEPDIELGKILETNDSVISPQVCENIDDSNYTDISRTESELRNLSTCLSDQLSNNNDLTVGGNQYQLKAFIDNNVPQILDKKVILNEHISEDEVLSHRNDIDSISENSIAENTLDSSLNHSCPIISEERLMEFDKEGLQKILNNIPEIYSRQILEMLEKQQQEQLYKLKAAESKISKFYGACPLGEHDKIEDCGYIAQKEFSCILEYDSVHLTDELVTYRGNVCSDIVQTVSKDFEDLHSKTILSCSRELFPNCDEDTSLQLKEHAASIIGAAAKGYLVRRLMRTDRVQTLIQTIRDALICAMQLHSENNDNINESDVELHRRLIQQVSAACFEFHDVFFALNTSEQMTIIRVDRDKQKEKLKRPLSRSSSAGKSSRSSRSAIK